MVDSQDKMNSLKSALENCDEYSLDLETTGLDFFDDKVVGFAFGTDENTAWYVPVCHKDSVNWTIDRIKENLYQTMLSKNAIYFNAGFDRGMLQEIGMDTPDKFEDVMLLIYHFDTERYKGLGLKEASKTFLNREMIEFKELFGDEDKFKFVPILDEEGNPTYYKGGKKKGQPKLKKVKVDNLSIQNKTAQECLDYAASDGLNTLALYNKFRSQLPKRLETVYRLDTKFIDYIIDIIKSGYSVDIKYLVQIKDRLEKLKDDLQGRIDSIAGRPVNVYAADSVWDALESLGVKPEAYTKTGRRKFDEKTMEKVDHELAKFCLQLKSIKRMISTFVDKLIQGVHRKTGRAHSGYTYTWTATGRLSANAYANKYGVNIQQAAKDIIKDKSNPYYEEFKGESMRKGIVPPKGYLHAKFDLGAAELRIAAHISREPVWLEGFRNNEDLHQKLADKMNKEIPGLNIDRPGAKNAQFNLLYAFWHTTFAKNNGISMEQAKEIYKAFFSTVKNYHRWREQYCKKMRAQGYSETYYGRRRMLNIYKRAFEIFPKINWSVPRDLRSEEQSDLVRLFNSFRSQGDREGINHKIQGTCLDILKHAGIRIRNHFIETGEWMHTVIPAMCVHDEFNFYIKADSLQDPYFLDTLKIIKKFMTTRPQGFLVDIESTPEVGINWKQLEEIDI